MAIADPMHSAGIEVIPLLPDWFTPSYWPFPLTYLVLSSKLVRQKKKFVVSGNIAKKIVSVGRQFFFLLPPARILLLFAPGPFV